MTQIGGTEPSTASTGDDLIDIESSSKIEFVRIPLSELERIRNELARLRRHSPTLHVLHQQLIALCKRYKECQ